MELQANLEKFRQQGFGVAAISYDSPAVLKDFAERKQIRYPLLSDQDSKTIRAFGILNEEVPAKTPFYGIPHPGTYMVDPRGKVLSKYFEDDYTQRYTSSDILLHQFGELTGGTHTTTQTKHLRISVSAGNGKVRSGQRIALALDIELKPGMHVYAPGVEGYIPVDWSMKDAPAIAVHIASYPASKKLHLPAIDETVPVYEGSFRVTRDVTIAKDSALKPLLDSAGNLTIEGAFKYQACDDRMCYLPQTVPLKWTVQVESHDRERAPAELQRKAAQ